MNPQRTVQTTMWLMIIAQTVGSVDLPGFGPRKLPAPRQYVGIITLWSILGLGADASAGIARASAALSWLLVLTGMVLGPFGKRAVSLLKGVTTLYPSSPQTTTSLTQPTLHEV